MSRCVELPVCLPGADEMSEAVVQWHFEGRHYSATRETPAEYPTVELDSVEIDGVEVICDLTSEEYERIQLLIEAREMESA